MKYRINVNYEGGYKSEIINAKSINDVRSAIFERYKWKDDVTAEIFKIGNVETPIGVVYLEKNRRNIVTVMYKPIGKRTMYKVNPYTGSLKGII